MSDLIGKSIGQYQIVEQIGLGGMATVYKAYQPSIDRYVAIKILPKQLAHDPNFVKRFQHEARAIAALEHPHILPIHDFDTEGEYTYLVMRYVEGGTLTNLMGQSLPYERIIQIVGNIARALDYAHQQGVVHRDIKPSNIRQAWRGAANRFWHCQNGRRLQRYPVDQCRQHPGYAGLYVPGAGRRQTG